MQQTELTTFLVLVNIILLVFITGIIVFFLRYRMAKIKHIKEKGEIHKQHQLDLLNGRLDMQQRTMQHIGREIHDSVGQKLTLASLYAQQLHFENKYPNINEKLKSIGEIVNDSLSELRSLSKTLVDEQSDDTLLTVLLETECRRIKAAGVCDVSFVSEGSEIVLSPAEKNILLRIVQEFMQNSLKHSNCSLISLHFHSGENALNIEAADDGKGFDMNTVHSPGLGLNNMKRRAALIGASFELQSSMGSGTKLDLSFTRQ